MGAKTVGVPPQDKLVLVRRNTVDAATAGKEEQKHSIHGSSHPFHDLTFPVIIKGRDSYGEQRFMTQDVFAGAEMDGASRGREVKGRVTTETAVTISTPALESTGNLILTTRDIRELVVLNAPTHGGVLKEARNTPFCDFIPLFSGVSGIFHETPVKPPYEISPVKVYAANFSPPETRSTTRSSSRSWG